MTDAQARSGQVGPAPRRFVSRLRAAANITALVGAILFFVLLVFSWDRPALVWFVARAGLITITALITSFIAIVVENRQRRPEDGTPR